MEECAVNMITHNPKDRIINALKLIGTQIREFLNKLLLLSLELIIYILSSFAVVAIVCGLVLLFTGPVGLAYMGIAVKITAEMVFTSSAISGVIALSLKQALKK